MKKFVILRYFMFMYRVERKHYDSIYSNMKPASRTKICDSSLTLSTLAQTDITS